MEGLRPETSPRKRDEIFGSFFIAGSEFAISVGFVQEVVNPPAAYSSLPLSAGYLVGLFNLRGAIIPVIDLQKLLDLKGGDARGERKIAILELDGHCIGVLFERTGEIFRGVEEEKSEFLEGSEGKGCVQGVFKKDGGERIVQILNVSALFRLDRLPKAAESARRQEGRMSKKGARSQCIAFTVGPAQCALGISEIQEIIKIKEVTHTALAVGNCVGAFDLRGVTVPIIDFGAFLKYREPEASDDQFAGDRRVVVLRIGDGRFGLLVDSVNSIVTYHDEDVRPFPALTSERADMFAGCVSAGGSETLLLNPRFLFTNEEIGVFTRGHSQLFRANATDSERRADAASPRRTFVTFRIEDSFAIPIGDIREIIEVPKSLLKPPGLPDSCLGVLNLRGKMVLIADGRSLYSEPKRGSTGDEKVLVFKADDQYFGLVVDSVVAIRSFSESEKVPLPRTLYASDSLTQQDLGEAVTYKDAEGRENSLLILHAAAINARMRALRVA